MLSVKHLRGYFRYLALAFLIVVIALFVVPASASDELSLTLDDDTVGGVIYIEVPYGYFDNSVSFYSGTTDIGSVSVSWDDAGYVTLQSDSYGSPFFYGCGFGLYASAMRYEQLIWSTSRFSQAVSFGDMLSSSPKFYAGSGDFAFYVKQYRSSDVYDNYQNNHIVITVPTTPTPTPTVTPSVPDPTITSFTVSPTYAYQNVLLDVTLVGNNGVSARVVPSSGSASALSLTSDNTWTGHVSFSAVGTYTVYGTLTNSAGKTVSSGSVTVNIIESPRQPIIHNTSVTYDMGYDHPVITTYVTYPTGVNADPDRCFFINWGDGSTTYYDGFIDGVPYGYPIYVAMSHVYTSEGRPARFAAR